MHCLCMSTGPGSKSAVSCWRHILVLIQMVKDGWNVRAQALNRLIRLYSQYMPRNLSFSRA